MENKKKETNIPKYYNIPSSPTSDMHIQILTSGKNIDALPERKRKINHNNIPAIAPTMEDGFEGRTISFYQGDKFVNINFRDINMLSGYNKTTKKLFLLILNKFNEKHLKDAEDKFTIEIPFKELAEKGIYSSPNAAKDKLPPILSVLNQFSLTEGEKENCPANYNRQATLFPYWEKARGKYIIGLNPWLNWGTMFSYFTIIPTFSFGLPSKSFDLTYFIFYLARQNIVQLKKEGFFRISLRALQYRLDLPSETDNGNPKRTIKDVIENSIADINAMAKLENEDLSIKIVCDSKAKISDYLDNGYIEVKIGGTYLDYFTKFNESKLEKIIENTTKGE